VNTQETTPEEYVVAKVLEEAKVSLSYRKRAMQLKVAVEAHFHHLEFQKHLMQNHPKQQMMLLNTLLVL
jgi:hypothetical protein